MSDPTFTLTRTGAQLEALHTKVDGIAAGATQNASDAALRDRATHTGTQPASTISDFAANVAGHAEVAANTAARHASNDPNASHYTKAELVATGGAHDKIDWSHVANTPAFGSEHWLEPVDNIAGRDAITSPQAGDCVLVRDDGDGKAAQYHYNGAAWVKIGDVDWTPLTDPQVKAAYERNADTNAFTDSEKSALAANTSARHSHANLAVLDASTAAFTTALQNLLNAYDAQLDVSSGDLVVTSSDGTAELLRVNAAGGTQLTYAGTLRAETTDGSFNVVRDSAARLRLTDTNGNIYLQISGTPTQSTFESRGVNSKVRMFVYDGSQQAHMAFEAGYAEGVALLHGGAERLKTTPDGVAVKGTAIELAAATAPTGTDTATEPRLLANATGLYYQDASGSKMIPWQSIP